MMPFSVTVIWSMTACFVKDMMFPFKLSVRLLKSKADKLISYINQ